MYNYNYAYYGSSIDSTDGIFAVLAGIGAAAYIVSLAIAILIIVAMWKIFVKAGKPGWAAIIPVYNVIVSFQIVGINPWLLLLYFVPIVNIFAIIVLQIMYCSKLAKAFGKSGGFAVGLFFLNVIFLPILAFSDAEYKGIEQ